MFVPIDLLKPILADSSRPDRRAGPARPWLGVAADEVQGRLDRDPRVARWPRRHRPASRPATSSSASAATAYARRPSSIARCGGAARPGADIPLRVLQGIDVQGRQRAFDRPRRLLPPEDQLLSLSPPGILHRGPGWATERATYNARCPAQPRRRALSPPMPLYADHDLSAARSCCSSSSRSWPSRSCRGSAARRRVDDLPGVLPARAAAGYAYARSGSCAGCTPRAQVQAAHGAARSRASPCCRSFPTAHWKPAGQRESRLRLILGPARR